MKKPAYEGNSTSHGVKILSGSDRIKIKSRRAAQRGSFLITTSNGAAVR